MKISIKKLTISVLGLFGILYSVPVQAQTVGVATTYNIKVNKIELCKSAACTSPITIGSGATTFNIASAAVGAEIGSYASLSSVPKGVTITHIRATLSRNIGVAGVLADPGNVGGTCGTNIADVTSTITAAGIGLVGAGGTEQALLVPNELSIAGQPTAGTYAAQNITLTSATEMTLLQALPASFTVGDIPPNVDIAFATATALQAFDDNGGAAGGNCWMLPAPPIVTVTVK